MRGAIERDVMAEAIVAIGTLSEGDVLGIHAVIRNVIKQTSARIEELVSQKMKEFYDDEQAKSDAKRHRAINRLRGEREAFPV